MMYPADVVLFEGILMFYSQEIRDLFQMKLFVDTDADTRLSRRGETHKQHQTVSFNFKHEANVVFTERDAEQKEQFDIWEMRFFTFLLRIR